MSNTSSTNAFDKKRKLEDGGDGGATRARRGQNAGLRVQAAASLVRTPTWSHNDSVKVTAIITVTAGVDLLDYFGVVFKLDLVSSTEVDPSTKEPKTIAGEAKCEGFLSRDKFDASFEVPREFGEVGAILIENRDKDEKYITTIVLLGFPYGEVKFSCNSWVHSHLDNHDKRIFFTDKAYLPSQTPNGLKGLRKYELKILRGEVGDGHERRERKKHDRIYDYDTYNDLGNPDETPDLARPILGGNSDFPYPRRCKTGRPHTTKDPKSESRPNESFFKGPYVPRDEAFSTEKETNFYTNVLHTALHDIIPFLHTVFENPDSSFPHFTAIDLFFNQGVKVPGIKPGVWNYLSQFLPRIIDDVAKLLHFEQPKLFERDRFSWMTDEEFARQTLAGVNPLSIKRVTEWPIKSKLDTHIYGPAESALTKELVEREFKQKGYIMTLEQALQENRLFILDYHDALLPYVNKVRELKDTTLYGSRTLFILDDKDGTLKPLAIELTRPPSKEKPHQWKEVYTPGTDATSDWTWRLAKAHVLAHDTGYHQLISHWLRTHCSTEPYIIAANRQLSAMHPIYRLLHPHFRYTMEINALARKSLINAGGTIETTFSPGKYSMELSSKIYGLEWRFDHEALPADLIKRGMAIEDPKEKHGLKLMIEDYPYASDGLDLWAMIKQWVTDYVKIYYGHDPTLVDSDHELQEWWKEVRNVGHGDKKDEPWWPTLKSNEDLIHILTTIIWVNSGHHAAVNFGQYAYGGYFPNRPTVTRTKMPTEDRDEDKNKWNRFVQNPEQILLECYPNQIQAIKFMTVLYVLSSHSPEEEYIGQKMESSWEAEPMIKAAFEKFKGRLKVLEGIIDERNANEYLKNRNGVGVVPYELLKPTSGEGCTTKGVPNSISI